MNIYIKTYTHAHIDTGTLFQMCACMHTHTEGGGTFCAIHIEVTVSYMKLLKTEFLAEGLRERGKKRHFFEL